MAAVLVYLAKTFFSDGRIKVNSKLVKSKKVYKKNCYDDFSLICECYQDNSLLKEISSISDLHTKFENSDEF